MAALTRAEGARPGTASLSARRTEADEARLDGARRSQYVRDHGQLGSIPMYDDYDEEGEL